MSDATILIVEDEDAIRLSFRDFLKKKGYNVLVASDGVGAIKHLLDNKVDLILSDYRMDILGGDYWVRFLSRYLCDVKVVISSGFLQPEFEIAFPVVQKPFNYGKMEEQIRELLNGESS